MKIAGIENGKENIFVKPKSTVLYYTTGYAPGI